MDLPLQMRSEMTEEAIASLAGWLHQAPQKVWAAMSAARPSLLSLYCAKVGTPTGADRVFEASRTTGPLLVDALPEAFAGEQGRHAMDMGLHSANALLGKDVTDGLATAISRFSGLDIGSSRSVVGAANLMSLADIHKWMRPASGQDLATHLDESKAAILAAIPEGLKQYLDTIPPLRPVAAPYDDGSPATSTDYDMEGEAAIPRQENRLNDTYYRLEHGDHVPSSTAWVLPALAIAVVAGVLTWVLYPGKTGGKPMATGEPSEAQITGEAQLAGALIGGISTLANLATPSDSHFPSDLAEQIEQFSRSLHSPGTLAMGPDAMGKLSEVSKSLDTLKRRFESLPLMEQQLVARQLNRLLPSIDSAAEHAMSVPSNSAHVDRIHRVVEQLHELARQPA